MGHEPTPCDICVVELVIYFAVDLTLLHATVCF